MAIAKRRSGFYDSKEGTEVKLLLAGMEADKTFNTATTYSADAETYPDHQIPFVDKHMRYLSMHPSTDPKQYVANLRLMTRVR
jgi:hypothetical protein